MPATAQSGVPHNPFLVEPRRALFTPSASPSVGPPDRPATKRPRLRSTPSSSKSATPSASNESASSVDVNSARRASTLHVLNVWAQLAERYNKRLDEDDIVDLYSGAIIKDRGVIKNSSTDCQFGHLNQPDDDREQEDSEQDDDDNELNAHPPSEATTDDDAPVSKKIVLRGVPPLPATTDVEDLREFLEAERERREIAGDEDEVDMPPEQLSALRTALEEQSRKVAAAQSEDVARTELPREGEVDITPTRPSIRAPPSDDESEDELAVWTHDESTAVYPIAREESEQDVQEVEQEVIELAELDSDAEFEALLVHPPRYSRSSPSRVPLSKEVQQPLQSPPNSGRGKSKPRTRSRAGIKSTVTRKSEGRPESPLMRRKPEVVLTLKKRPSVLEETGTITPDDTGSDQEVIGRIPPMYKVKGKEVLPLAEDNLREKIPESPEMVSRGRKRKRIISSSTNDGPLIHSPERKSSSRSRGKSISQSGITLPQSNNFKQTHDKDASTPVRFESVIPHTLRPPSRPPPIFSSPNQETPGLSPAPYLPPPPPIDPAQAQQAHCLLAQAMHQLSYLISATMPTCTPCASNPGQPWLHPPLVPHPAYSTPVHHPPHFHGTCPYHTPSSSVARSELPPSSPVRSSVSPPIEEQRAQSRGRSRSRGRRVSFKLNSEEVFVSREHDVRPEVHHSRLKSGKQALEIEKGKARTTKESDDSLRILEDQGSPPREVARARTPGPPSSRKKVNVPRGRSLIRR